MQRFSRPLTKIHCYYSWQPDTEKQTEAIRRFKATGGVPPKGVTLIGRWTRADFMGGVDVLESDDPSALTQFSLMWSDVMKLEIVPALEDRELIDVFERTGK